MTAFSPGRRALTIAALATIAAGILHTVGNLVPLAADDELRALRRSMQAYHLPLGLGMAPSLWDIQRSLVFTMSVCLLAMGLMVLLVAADRDSTPRLRSRVAQTGAAASLALTVLYALYRVPPPLLTMGVVTLPYLVAARPARALRSG